jgi:hypothetical protein
MQTIYHGAAVVPRRRSKTRGSPLTPAHQLEAATACGEKPGNHNTKGPQA